MYFPHKVLTVQNIRSWNCFFFFWFMLSLYDSSLYFRDSIKKRDSRIRYRDQNDGSKRERWIKGERKYSVDYFQISQYFICSNSSATTKRFINLLKLLSVARLFYCLLSFSWTLRTWSLRGRSLCTLFSQKPCPKVLKTIWNETQRGHWGRFRKISSKLSLKFQVFQHLIENWPLFNPDLS